MADMLEVRAGRGMQGAGAAGAEIFLLGHVPTTMVHAVVHNTTMFQRKTIFGTLIRGINTSGTIVPLPGIIFCPCCIGTCCMQVYPACSLHSLAIFKNYGIITFKASRYLQQSFYYIIERNTIIMHEKYNKEILNLIRSMQNIDYISPEDIPGIDLYMDQVTTFMDEHLKSSKRFDDDKILTKTMINNYTKNNLLPPPDKKKYTKEHMLLLIFIYYFKNFLAINDIKSVLDPVTKKFFKSENGRNLDSLYKEIVELAQENMDSQLRDIIRKLKKSNEIYAGIKDAEEQKILSKFAFICMLSFDVWVKKNIIENIIDDTFGKKKN